MAKGIMQLLMFVAAGLLSAFVAHASFNTEWKCPSSPCTIYLPLETTGVYKFDADWGDGSPLQVVSGAQTPTSVSHVYPAGGNISISITGELQGFRFNSKGSRLLLTKVLAWGQALLGNSGDIFKNCENLVAVPSTEPPGVTNYKDMFYNCKSFNDPNISTWITAMVTTMIGMFNRASVFNQPLGVWEVGRVTNMHHMFYIASTFSQNLSSWDVCAVTDYVSFASSSGLTTLQMPAFGGSASCAPTTSPTTVAPTVTTTSPSSAPTTSPIVSPALLVIEDGALLTIKANSKVRVGL